MKILSPKKRKESLMYVVTTLMNLPAGNNLLRALIHDMDSEENLDIYRLVTMSEEEIEGLEYTPDGAHANTKPTKLIRSLKTQICKFVGWFWVRDKAGSPIEDFLSLTPEEFVEYSLEPKHQKVNNPNNRPATLAPPGQCLPLDLLAESRRGVKQDPTIFEMIKDIKQWDAWKRTFMPTAKAQGVKKAIDTMYIPPPSEDALFHEQKKYMYSVLLNVVKAMTLKTIDPTKEAIPDCWDAMCKEAEHSTSAEIKSSDILAYITSMKFDDGKWRGMSSKYIAHWCEQVWVYESLSTNGANHFSDVMKKQMLQNALDNIDDFRNIHTFGQQTGQAITFDDYKALVHSVADAYDKRSRAKEWATHNAYSHDIDVYNPVDFHYDGYDLGTNIDMIYANAADTHNGMISSNHFHQMTPEGHKIWPPNDCKLMTSTIFYCSTVVWHHNQYQQVW